MPGRQIERDGDAVGSECVKAINHLQCSLATNDEAAIDADDLAGDEGGAV